MKKRLAKGEKWIMQTKIRPYDVREGDALTDGGLYATAAKEKGEKTSLLLRRFILETEYLPRQARDRATQKEHSLPGSLDTLGYSERKGGPGSVDMITIHGVNSPHHVNTCLQPMGSIEQAAKLKEDGLCKAVGFAAHCHCGDIIKVIDKSFELGKPLDYVNIHYGFFSSYTNIDNQPAGRRDAVVFALFLDSKSERLAKTGSGQTWKTGAIHSITRQT
jgi:hypothetical protein